METNKQPGKEQVRDWIAQRQLEHKPPPDLRQIRRQLGWGLNASVRARRWQTQP